MPGLSWIYTTNIIIVGEKMPTVTVIQPTKAECSAVQHIAG